jgi:hypothetical protein
VNEGLQKSGRLPQRLEKGASVSRLAFSQQAAELEPLLRMTRQMGFLSLSTSSMFAQQARQTLEDQLATHKGHSGNRRNRRTGRDPKPFIQRRLI